MTRLAVVPAAVLLALAGCSSIGPATVPRDRFEYSTSIGESWKRQTLLNIVKLRYLDPPIFVDVGQIVAGYTLETAVSAGATLVDGGPNTLGLGAATRYSDRPTITYTPLTGNKFVKSLMTPLVPDSVFFMIQAGWPADGVLLASVAAINGLRNQESSISGTTPPSAEFMRVAALLRQVQLSGGVALRVRQDEQKGQTSLLTFRRKDIAPETLAATQELRRLLKLDPEADEFTLVFGATAANDREVAVLTRSILQLMTTMSAQVDVPPDHLEQHMATPGWESAEWTEVAGGAGGAPRLVEIHSGSKLPDHAYVAVTYKDYWYWIDDRDLRSKRVFAYMMLLFTLADTGEKEPLPLITIPAQ